VALAVVPITYDEALPWLLGKHYARRVAPVSFAFGAYMGGVLVGVVTYGVPASAPLRRGVCGPDWSDSVLELNRLCCDALPNLPSRLIGHSLRLLPAPSVVVSYADTSMGHVGYVYQATNFLYTGLSAKRTDWSIEGVNSHGVTIADKTRGMPNRAQAIREMFGDRFSLQPRPRKHRYVFFCGTKRERRLMANALRYPVLQYPKGETARYDDGPQITTQTRLMLND
jgi:hypothetical protein